VAGPSFVAEIAERVGARPRCRLAVVVPLRPGAQEEVRRLVAQGPPFDPDTLTELDRHEVFLTPEEAILVFESDRGADSIAALLSRAEFSKAAGAWEKHVAGPPRIAESVYSWARAEDTDELSFLPTPGPGDSDGGDIF